MFRHTKNRSAPQTPTFNIVPPFMGVLVVQLNHAMSLELQHFISSINEEDVDEEVDAFRQALRDPAQFGVYVFKEGPSLLAMRSFKGVVIVEMNLEMRDILVDFISEIDGGVDKIIWAFRLALENPEGGRPVKTNKQSGIRRRRSETHSRSDESDVQGSLNNSSSSKYSQDDHWNQTVPSYAERDSG